MRLLVLGGGGFLGYHVVTAALAAGHEVTVLSRSGTAPVEGVDVVTGDRQGDLSGLRGREWDAAFDTFNDTDDGAPAIAATAGLLAGSVGTYGYVSGMSVYAPTGPDVPDETAPVRTAGLETDRLQERSLAKLAGEAAVRERFGEQSFFPRVGIMVGPRSTRYTYWPVRIAGAVNGSLGQTVLVAGDLDRPVQYSDARSIAAWCVRMLAEGRGGTYNTVGPGRPDTLRAVLDACAVAAGAGSLDDLDTVVAPEDLMRRKLLGIDEEERPLWFPEDQIPQLAIDSSKALAAGLTFSTPLELATDTLAWARDADEAALTDGTFARLEPALVDLVGRH
ncbi:NAD-dependent epimerase/dehydratase family protein [Microlunatus flavus]|uniref:2'-hydroxyisoflavone reductase n=1 Tax=Microlunatus flavus TaxID=1036181 RepID=A0A1H9L440_9ACTN|nr:NAD-dependent epimerase/dehydratase family protein [Microlunatus flavus]SER06140.1 2'-hydroxyisoflavone reductase [Microlunatus flavus]